MLLIPHVSPARRLAGVGCLALLFAASAAGAQTLNDALVAAYRSSPELGAMRARIVAGGAQVSEARAGWRPSVSVNGSVGTEQIDTALSPAMGGATLSRSLSPTSIALAVNQRLYDGGSASASIDSAEHSLEAVEAGLAQTEQRVFLAAATAYLDVLLEQQVLAMQQQNEQVLQRQLEATRLRQRAGELTPTDVYQAQARLAAATAAVRRAEADLSAARAAYVRATGGAPDGLVAPGAVGGLPASLAEAEAKAQANNPQLAEAQARWVAARDEVRSVHASGGPRVSLVGEVRRDTDDSIFTNRTDTQRVMLEAKVPLYVGGADSARTVQADQAAAERLAELDLRRQQVTEAVTAAWETWQAAQAEGVAFVEQQRAADAALKGVRAERDAGTRTVLDVLNAQQELLNAQVSVARAHHDEQVAAYGLLAAVGNLTARAMGLSGGNR